MPDQPMNPMSEPDEMSWVEQRAAEVRTYAETHGLTYFVVNAISLHYTNGAQARIATLPEAEFWDTIVRLQSELSTLRERVKELEER
jgi:hypothetical protein